MWLADPGPQWAVAPRRMIYRILKSIITMVNNYSLYTVLRRKIVEIVYLEKSKLRNFEVISRYVFRYFSFFTHQNS